MKPKMKRKVLSLLRVNRAHPNPNYGDKTVSNNDELATLQQRVFADPDDLIAAMRLTALERRLGIFHTTEEHTVEGPEGWVRVDNDFWDQGEMGRTYSAYDSMWTPPYSTYGDYIGSDVERSNQLELIDMLDAAEEATETELLYSLSYPGYGSVVLYIQRQAYLPRDVVEAINGLADYPLINEDRYSECENETREINWSNWGRDEFRRILEEECESWEDRSDEDIDAEYTNRNPDNWGYGEGGGAWAFPGL